MWIFSRKHRRREKPGIARIPDDLSKKLQKKGEPLGTMCLLIMQLAVRFFEELPNQILSSSEDDRVGRERSVFLALFSFYAYLMMVFARQGLTVAQLEYMQKYITIVAAEGVIDYYHAGCTEEARQSLATALARNVNDGITQYTNAIGFTQATSKVELETKLPDLVSRAGRDVATACGQPSDTDAIKVIQGHVFISYMIIVEAVRVDELLLEIRASMPV